MSRVRRSFNGSTVFPRIEERAEVLLASMLGVEVSHIRMAAYSLAYIQLVIAVEADVDYSQVDVKLARLAQLVIADYRLHYGEPPFTLDASCFQIVWA